MPYCAKCRSEIPEDARFCPICGAPTGEAPTATYAHIEPPRTAVSGSLFERMIRAARLDPSLYEEVEADEAATTQALTVVVISSVCSGIGSAMSRAFRGAGPRGIGIGLVGGLFTALAVWLIWSYITYLVGTRVFGGTASYRELLRTIGFSDSPGVLLILSFVPVLGGLISFAVWVWGLVAMVVAVRQALDFSTGRAVLTCIVGWIAAIVLLIVVGILLAIPFILFWF